MEKFNKDIEQVKSKISLDEAKKRLKELYNDQKSKIESGEEHDRHFKTINIDGLTDEDYEFYRKFLNDELGEDDFEDYRKVIQKHLEKNHLGMYTDSRGSLLGYLSNKYMYKMLNEDDEKK